LSIREIILNGFSDFPFKYLAFQFSLAHIAANLSGTGYKHNLVFNAPQQMVSPAENFKGAGRRRKRRNRGWMLSPPILIKI
jgi:hypothetical protein